MIFVFVAKLFRGDCPSAKQIDKINLLLLDVSDIEKIRCLRLRNTYGVNQDMLNWSSCLRMHHYDPQWHQNVIKDNCRQDLVIQSMGHTWNSLASISTIDTTGLSIEQILDHIINWVKAC